ncbi:hypothetical protein NSA47_05875 [Irregularibacter muris]|uniref:Uncharacterized protein n=1 Tax=Irregularibacter muris TaxID=1796619 RepID=A0AAE3HGB7_9FIRM|nr:hypothetical protein [Irregularibacter muris]MCR1898519.1 hypothetical protein [Irregularibacter muris]
MSIDKRFIVNLQGKEFVTYEGLLDTAHQKGLTGIETQMVSYDPQEHRAIFRAVAHTKEGSFTGYGDADTTNVNRMISRHIIRMAETRAKARALRDLTNIGMTALEELGEDDSSSKDDSSNIISDVEAKKLEALLSNKNIDKDKVLEYYHVPALKSLTKGKAEHLKNTLNRSKQN